MGETSEGGLPCPSCDYGLWHVGHECYTYEEWYENQKRYKEEQAAARIQRPEDADIEIYYYENDNSIDNTILKAIKKKLMSHDNNEN